MADNSAFFSDLDATIKRLDSLQDQAIITRVERKGLEAVVEVALPAVIAATPVAHGRLGTTSLAPGELKASVRARILPEENGKPQAAVIDHGKNSYVARFLDQGTATIAATGFVRRVVDGTRGAAEAAFVEEASAELDQVLHGR